MKKVTWLGLVTISFGLVIALSQFGLWFKSEVCADYFACKNIYNHILSLTFFGLPLFIASLVALCLNDANFKKFLRLTVYSYVVYCVAVLLTPWDISGGSFSGPDFSKGLMAWFMGIIYLVISIIYTIILKLQQKKSKS